MKPKTRKAPRERWTAQTLIDEARIFSAAVAISDRRTSWARQMERVSRLLVWAAANLRKDES